MHGLISRYYSRFPIPNSRVFLVTKQKLVGFMCQFTVNPKIDRKLASCYMNCFMFKKTICRTLQYKSKIQSACKTIECL